MHIERRFMRMLAVLLVVFAGNAFGNTLQFQVVAAPGRAAAANSNESFVFIRISNADGTPKDDAKIETRQDPKGGLELKGSPWSFTTLLVPPGYAGRVTAARKDIFGNIRATQFEVAGQLRIVAMGRLDHGVYWLRILPLYGPQGSVKGMLKWVSGAYVFRISYNDGQTQGDSLGLFNVP